MRTQAIRRAATIDYRCEAYDWAFARDAAVRIDAHWADLRAEKPGLFDGRVLVAHDLAIDQADGGTLRARGFETNYKPFLCWRDFGFPGAPVVNLFAMAALRSADGAFILGEMSAGTASAGKLYFPAGTPEPADADAAGIVDLQANALRELAEETGFGAADVTVEDGWTIVFDDARVACMKALRSPLSIEALMQRFAVFRAAEADPELDALVPVWSPDDLDATRMPGFMLTYLHDAFAAG
ncbi:NUDIX hydrolase [Beijerinckia sp. L45]|uniref:NUDIX hydrolase n=1 Tax=Beijerinckia sp. L45 TaxID=1641855 RepID=UPI00131E28CA|nr:NUDIX hydrolase [Beijerinckia sp. L45]